MIISPIIPIWIMSIICIVLIIITIKKDIKSCIRRLIIIVLLFVINLRIMLPTENAKVLTSNLDIFFVIDNTLSMLAEDYKGKDNRLEAVKSDCEYIVNELSGASYSILTVSDESAILTPLTKDSDMTIAAINTLNITDAAYAMGSSMSAVIDDLVDSLKRQEKNEDRVAIVFFISDGEITNDEKLKSFSGAKKYISNGAVLGYGTKEGGNMKVDYYGEKKYLEDTTSDKYPYPKALSKIDEGNLKKVADDMGIDYIHMEKQLDIKDKLKEIKQEASHNLDDSQKMLYDDIYFIFVIPLVALLIYEFINYKKKL